MTIADYGRSVLEDEFEVESSIKKLNLSYVWVIFKLDTNQPLIITLLETPAAITTGQIDPRWILYSWCMRTVSAISFKSYETYFQHCRIYSYCSFLRNITSKSQNFFSETLKSQK